MPYVVGTYRDKIGAADYLLGGIPQSVADCRRSIRWQVGPGHTGLPCRDHCAESAEYRISWHIADPAPDSPLSMVCRDCGAELHIRRGGFTWEAFHDHARQIWGDRIPLTVAELRLFGKP